MGCREGRGGTRNLILILNPTLGFEPTLPPVNFLSISSATLELLNLVVIVMVTHQPYGWGAANYLIPGASREAASSTRPPQYVAQVPARKLGGPGTIWNRPSVPRERTRPSQSPAPARGVS